MPVVFVSFDQLPYYNEVIKARMRDYFPSSPYHCGDCGDYVEELSVIHSSSTRQSSFCLTCWNAHNWTNKVSYCQNCGMLVYTPYEYTHNHCPICANETTILGETFTIPRTRRMIRPTQMTLNDYSYKPHPIFSGTGKLFFGIELEVDDGNRDSFRADLVKLTPNQLRKFYLKTDGSLGHSGVEIVTHPHSLPSMKKFPWSQISRFALQNEYRSHDTDTCGLHIHCSKNAVSLQVWSRVTVFWFAHQNKLERFCRRGLEHYCREKEHMYDCDCDRCVSETTNPDEASHYEAVNFENSQTVEFRQFKGTLKPETILASVELLHALIQFCKRAKMKHIANSATWSKFVQFVKAKPKIYSELIQALQNWGNDSGY